MVAYGCNGDLPCPRTSGRNGTSGGAASVRTSSDLTSLMQWSPRRPSTPTTSWSRSGPVAAPARSRSLGAASASSRWRGTPTGRGTCGARSRRRGAATVSVVCCDALRYQMPRRPFRALASLPFGATTAMLRHLLDDRQQRTAARRPDRPVGGGAQAGGHTPDHDALDGVGALVDLRHRPADTRRRIPAGAGGRCRRSQGDTPDAAAVARPHGRRLRRVRPPPVEVSDHS